MLHSKHKSNVPLVIACTERASFHLNYMHLLILSLSEIIFSTSSGETRYNCRHYQESPQCNGHRFRVPTRWRGC